MKKFWKVLSLATALCMLFGFAGCGETPEEPKEPDDSGIVTPGETDKPGGGTQSGSGENEKPNVDSPENPDEGGKGDNKQEEVVKHLAYEEISKENGEKAYEVVGLGEIEGSEIVIPVAFDGAPVERIGDYAFCAAEKISESEPVAVMILIDASLSMTEEMSDGKTLFDIAKAGAFAYTNTLRANDYCGVGVISDVYSHLLDPTPMTQKSEIQNAISGIQLTDTGTLFSNAIQAACELLSAVEDVAARHILIITDGVPGDSPAQTAQYLANLEAYYRTYGITCSVGGVNILGHDYEQGIVATMTQLTQAGHGNFFYPEIAEFPNACVMDLQTVKEDVTTEIETGQCELACKNIQIVTIPESVTSIGEGAFAGCENLTKIIFNGTRAQWNAIEKDAYWNYGMGNYTVHCTDDPELVGDE